MSEQGSSSISKRKKSNEVSNAIDLEIVRTLKTLQEKPQNHQVEDDSTALFCKSLIEPLRTLPKRDEQIVRIRFQQILYSQLAALEAAEEEAEDDDD